MSQTQFSRRTVLKGGLAVGGAIVFAQPLKAAAPPPSAVAPTLIEAARKEGKASFYTALELNTSERLARTFEVKYPGIAIRVERSGAERIYQRIIQAPGFPEKRSRDRNGTVEGLLNSLAPKVPDFIGAP